MQLSVFCVIFAVLVVVKANPCHKQEDCKPDECCIQKPLHLFGGGECNKLAGEGEKCNSGLDLTVFGKFYLLHCPCAAGLTCTPEKLFLGALKINETCVAEPTSKKPESTTQKVTIPETASQEEIVSVTTSSEKIVEAAETDAPVGE